jgi:small subunit ribosomal protein S9
MNKIKNLYSGLGKRKTSVAKVFLTEGTGSIKVNNKNFEDFFSGLPEEKELINNPFILVNLLNKFDLDIKVKGGGISSQMDAIRLAISKALCTVNNEFRPILNTNLLLRRDSRIKERRKYGLKKARKASQYSKR